MGNLREDRSRRLERKIRAETRPDLQHLVFQPPQAQHFAAAPAATAENRGKTVPHRWLGTGEMTPPRQKRDDFSAIAKWLLQVSASVGAQAKDWAMSLIDQSAYLETGDAAFPRPQRPVARRTSVVVRPVGGTVKRGIDIVVAAFALLVLSPLFLFTAVILRLTDPGPVFFGHKRVGLGGRTFHCLKFRTMCQDADAVLDRLLASDPELAAEWEATRKLRNDPRISRVGRVLREYSIDELPQLINVLRGEMSLVGPRPVVTRELIRYGNDAVHYLSARPGITGLWQVSGRSDTTYATRIALDARYVAGWSLSADASILLRTIPAVLGARGSC
jgi:exopolysaccharide production protein ExoY